MAVPVSQFDYLRIFNPEISLHQIAEDSGRKVSDLIQEALNWAESQGCLPEVGATILSQYWFRERRASRTMPSQNRFVSWATKNLRISRDQAIAAIQAAEMQISPPSSGENVVNMDSYRTGERFELVLSELLGAPIKFVPPAIDEARHQGFVMQLTMRTSFAALEKCLPEALSWTGFDAVRPFVQRLPRGQVSIHIPKKKGGKTLPLIQHLLDAAGMPPGETLEDSARQLVQYFAARQSAMTIVRRVILPIGVSILNKLVSIPLDTGVKAVGKTGSGKTNALLVLIYLIRLAYSPEQAKIAVIDMKSVTGESLKECGHLAYPVILANRFQREIPGLIRAIMFEAQRRETLFGEAGVFRIYDYNQRQLDNGLAPMPKLFVFVDEVLLALNSKEFAQFLFHASRMYSAFGIVFLVATQHAADMPPALRLNLGTALGHKTQSEAAVKIFQDRHIAPMVDGLLGRGDCVVEAETEDLRDGVRMQGFSLPLAHMEALNNALQRLHPLPTAFYLKDPGEGYEFDASDDGTTPDPWEGGE